MKSVCKNTDCEIRTLANLLRDDELSVTRALDIHVMIQFEEIYFAIALKEKWQNPAMRRSQE